MCSLVPDAPVCPQEYEKRLYGATRWISTDIRGQLDMDVIAANSKLKEYCGKLSNEGT